ncbi:helix-turn-helix transcriptional regulator [Actinomyces slackii]|uniref:Transcriptional activator FtrA n=1 Tax=Actinomyces slackii TaxID=52774 RepID=A0A448KB97_9ACTO|nr:helix-turn-helix transcriptional regulator [Actinomyces slackii]VEG74197.1 transcriptional activator FtrA [Actinomyces slackii]
MPASSASPPDQRERGVLHPERLPVDFRRLEPTGVEDLVCWFWAASWDHPVGEEARQEIIGFPGCNLAVETSVQTGGQTSRPTSRWTSMVGLAGPTTRASVRELEGRGWVIGALLRPAAVPALTPDPAGLRDRYVPLEAPGLHDAVASARAAGTDPGAQTAAVLGDWLRERVGEPSSEGLLANRMLEIVMGEAGVHTVADLAERLGVSPRTAHRLAARYVGLTPYAMIRRRRLQEAAGRVREGAELAEIAVELGYADQAHLARDFRAVLGRSAGGYRQASGAPAAGVPSRHRRRSASTT